MDEYAAARSRASQKAAQPADAMHLKSPDAKEFHAHEISWAKRLAKA